MSVKIEGLDEVPLQKAARFDGLSKEDTADIFDDLVECDGEDESEVHSPSITPTTERQRNRPFRPWKHPKFCESIWKVYPNANAHQV
ncbi:hypothetical protein LTR98_003127 [Exophiala xenobiotica]|uniref:Uncharacterized protein n=1 Tax=Vermiconidia calcicola TaxID=1690605 RepID=A0AAV9Q7A2_9PEZI|nr:hypothetical protein LTR98_003127 [Exophiala xenobiotica]KAK5534124.1 hypothetical protein LTR25_007104 [Vermiconidia calcicola]